ncbi:MAG: site-specific integrase [Lentisphaeria bacterium]|nr:site-specific integrase [Lentisphaeria bacterium]
MTFSHIVSAFFTRHLVTECGLAANTIASYSDCMKLLINYLCECLEIDPEAIDIQMISPERVLDFLDYIEKERGNATTTRNQRLAAIKTFFHFLARTVPELMHANERIQAIKQKSSEHHPLPSLTVEEVVAILACPDPSTLMGARDKALLQLMHNTGARVQELADITIADVRFDAPATVTVTGKGRKTRVIPLWEETAEMLTHYLELRKQLGIDSEHIFLSSRGGPMTRFGIGRRVALHAKAASAICPSLQGRNITPHVFRHTTALHLIEAGNDIFVVRDWLGHAHIKTASQYVEVSVERKRRALEKMPPPDGGKPPETPQWKQPAIMEFLTRCSRKERYVA